MLGGVHFVVDGMNVIGSRPDGWWRDRPAARRALVGELARLVTAGHAVMVVFDGRPGTGEPEAAAARGVTALFAPGGPNAADDVVVEVTPALLDAAGADLVVVTSDRLLAQRVHALGATVQGAGTFLARLAAADGL
jgi:predicted RNA-binding protein with PIN domain